MTADTCKANLTLVKAGRVQNREMARLFGVARYTVYRWLKANKTSVAGADRILRMVRDVGGRITHRDLIPFIDG
jgi:transposase